MDRPIVAVVLAGGTGTRLYPASRSDRPKQFRSFGGERSLLTRTVDRAGIADEVVVVTRAAFAEKIPAHAPGAEVLVEPAPKDTGPALVYAAHELQQRDDEPVLLVLPSDHHIGDGFAEAARTAVRVAVDTGRLVTFGIQPDRPATGYGYIEPGEDRDGWREVDRFHEKPTRSTADRYVRDGWYWNAGIFAWTPMSLLRAARRSRLAPLVDALEEGAIAAGFERVAPVSIDHAVLEGTDRAALVPATFAWDDLGTWNAIGRCVEGPMADTLEIDTEGTVIATDGPHVTAIDVSDLVIAAYDDRILVVPRGSDERVRDAVARLDADGRF